MTNLLLIILILVIAAKDITQIRVSNLDGVASTLNKIKDELKLLREDLKESKKTKRKQKEKETVKE